MASILDRTSRPAPRPYGAPRSPTSAIWSRMALREWSTRIRLLSAVNLGAVVTAFALVCLISEDWWLSALLTYLPRSLYAIPALLLLPASLWKARGAAWMNVLSLGLVAGPIMGLTMPVAAVAAPPAALRIVSANIQEGKRDPHRLIEEIERFQPDIIALQETSRGFEPFVAAWGDRPVVHLGEFLIASRYPLRVVDHCRPKAFDRWSAVLVQIDLPGGPVYLSDTHLATPRHGATGLTPFSILTGDGVDEFEFHQRLRDEEMSATAEFLGQHADRPLLMAGDFNTPTTSSLFMRHWGRLQSAFEAAGWGYGYTAPCSTRRWWPSNTPWVRIDHILADDHWDIHAARIGLRDASDHRVIFAEVSLKAAGGSTPE